MAEVYCLYRMHIAYVYLPTLYRHLKVNENSSASCDLMQDFLPGVTDFLEFLTFNFNIKQNSLFCCIKKKGSVTRNNFRREPFDLLAEFNIYNLFLLVSGISRAATSLYTGLNHIPCFIVHNRREKSFGGQGKLFSCSWTATKSALEGIFYEIPGQMWMWGPELEPRLVNFPS